MVVETPRMIIRHFDMHDVHDLHQILGDAETMALCEPAYTPEKTAAFLQSFCIDKKGALAAVHRESGRVIGYILFHELEEDMYEIGWFFNRKFWRQGLAYEACQALIDYAFDHMHAHKIFAETIDPQRSVRLMEKLGMKQEGVQRSHTRDNKGNWADLYLYGLLAEEYCAESR